MKLVTYPERIIELANERKCLYVKRSMGKPFIISAAFAQNWQLRYTLNLINSKRIFEYKKGEMKN